MGVSEVGIHPLMYQKSNMEMEIRERQLAKVNLFLCPRGRIGRTPDSFPALLGPGIAVIRALSVFNDLDLRARWGLSLAQGTHSSSLGDVNGGRLLIIAASTAAIHRASSQNCRTHFAQFIIRFLAQIS